MDRLIENDMVRIVQLHGPPEVHAVVADDGDDELPEELTTRRLPRVGDTGTLLYMLAARGGGLGHPDAPGTRYLVERIAVDGRREWLAEFARGELELVRRST